MHEPHHPPLPALRRRYREDGWTPTVQRQFVEALAEHGSVAKACEQVQRSTSTAYRLRAHPDAHAFRAAWNAATAMAYRQVFEAAMDRVVGGQEVPVFFEDQCIGHKVQHDTRLMCFMLHHLRPRDEPVAGVSVSRSGEDGQDVALAAALDQLDNVNDRLRPSLAALESPGAGRMVAMENAARDAEDAADPELALPPPVIDPATALLNEMIAGRDEIDKHFVAMRAEAAKPTLRKTRAATRRQDRRERLEDEAASREISELSGFLAKCKADPEGFQG